VNVKIQIILLLGSLLVGCGSDSTDDTGKSGGLKGSISGVVTDGDSGTGVINVRVSVLQNEVFSSTDGLYELNDIAVGDQTITASKSGYIDNSTSITITDNQTTSHSIVINPVQTSAGIPSDKIAAYWNMDSSSISNDVMLSVVGSVNGTINGAISTVSGIAGQAVSLDGIDDYIDFGDVLDEIFSGEDKKLSITVWLKSGSTNNRVILAKAGDTACNPDDNQREFYLSLIGANNSPQFAYTTLASASSGHAHELSNATTPLNEWFFMAITYDGTIDTSSSDRVSIYVNDQSSIITSQSVANFPFSMMDGNAHMSLGISADSSGNPCDQKGNTYFEGLFDELTIWNDSLSNTEVELVRQQGISGNPLVN